MTSESRTFFVCSPAFILKVSSSRLRPQTTCFVAPSDRKTAISRPLTICRTKSLTIFFTSDGDLGFERCDMYSRTLVEATLWPPSLCAADLVDLALLPPSLRTLRPPSLRALRWLRAEKPPPSPSLKPSVGNSWPRKSERLTTRTGLLPALALALGRRSVRSEGLLP